MFHLLKTTIISLTALCMLFGCAGIDSTVFYTKTNRGVEFSSTPPSIGLDISREEGVVTPQFEGGKTLPILASFKSETDGVFAGQLGSTFSTGKAATTLAKLYNSAVVGDFLPSQVEISGIPVDSDNKNPLQTNDIRPVFFTTKTSIGLNIGWSTITSAFPDSFTLGYNRKELAILPISYTKKGSSHYVDQASLLATLGFVYDHLESIPSSNGSTKGKTSYLQYFATGDSATNLATKPEVRQVMINRLDPSANLSLSTGAIAILPSLIMHIKDIAKIDSYADALLNKLNRKIFNMPDSYTVSGLKAFQDTGLDDQIQEFKVIQTFSSKNFEDLYSYLFIIKDQLDLSKLGAIKIEKAINSNPKTQVSYKDESGTITWTRVPTDTDLKQIELEINKIQDEYIRNYQMLAKDKDVKALFEYIVSKISSGA